MKAASGQSMSEYTLIGGVVALSAVVALSFMGTRLSGLFGSMIGKPQPMAPVTVANLPAPAPTLPPAVSTPAPPVVGTTAPPASGVSIHLPNGSSLNLSLPTSIPHSVQTVGANGTTEMLASSLQTMANQMLASGDINQTQANTILQLANEAHHLAEIQKTLEDDSASNGTDVNAFKTKPVVIDGTTYANAYQAALSIGYDDANNRGPELQRFWDLYTNATSAVYMWPPELKAVLEYHATAVNDLSDSMRVAMRDIIQYNAGTPAELNSRVASTMTHKQSASICTMQDGNADSGVQCSGT
jgi:hypothetical protein